jgi:hypothetical protein
MVNESNIDVMPDVMSCVEPLRLRNQSSSFDAVKVNRSLVLGNSCYINFRADL